MIKIKALITLVVGVGKEIVAGEKAELEDKEANRLHSLGFVEIIKTPAKGQTNGSSPPKSDK